MVRKILLPVLAGSVLLSCAATRKTKGVTVREQQPDTVVAKTDTVKKAVKVYRDVITAKAVTNDGLIKVHQVEGRYYFELADSILNKDILIVNRISKAAEAVRPGNGLLGYAGDYIGENVVRFEKGPDNKLFIKRVTYLDLSKDSSENGMYRSVYNSSLLPIAASFDIKAYAPDSSSSVIDITDFIKGDNDVFFFNPAMKKNYGLGALQTDRSYTAAIRSFPLNTEVKTVKTYQSGESALTYELNSSLVLLPAEPMKPRYYDNRVGYFARGFRNFDFPQAAQASYMITRWRLEPRTEDLEKYKRGELVKPRKPIVFYIDPATPKKWVPYLISGVNSWQKAFEKAGFKEAIYALEVPANDITWSLEDARHNVIVYKPSFVQNASGPQVSDPRSGEILESHINWYHNVQQLLHDWYFIQASPNDPAAQKMEFDDLLMGRLITFVCTHEVGHTLGLQHNFIASSAIPVDSLRSRNYVAENSHTASIMDYARFNYVAQPEDGIAVKDLIPRIGVYDEWAIEWGYRWLPGLMNNEEEKAYMNRWIVQRLEKDKRLIFATERSRDYRAQMEDLGDDAMRAGYYGIKNLQRVMAHLEAWTLIPNNDYKDLSAMQNALIGQYTRYINHVCEYLGGATAIPKTAEQAGPVLVFADRAKQQAAIRFLHDYFFDNTDWLANKALTPFTGRGAVLLMFNLHVRVLHDLLRTGEVYNGLLPNETYSYDELLTDLEAGFWKELKTHAPINVYRQSLQRTYVSILVEAWSTNRAGGDFSRLNACTVLADHIEKLYATIGRALGGYAVGTSKTHLKDLHNRLKAAVDFNKKYVQQSSNTGASVRVTIGFTGDEQGQLRDPLLPAYYENSGRGCWENNIPGQ